MKKINASGSTEMFAKFISKLIILAAREIVTTWDRQQLDSKQLKTLILLMDVDKKIARNSVFDCHLSPVGRQLAIENSVSNDF